MWLQTEDSLLPSQCQQWAVRVLQDQLPPPSQEPRIHFNTSIQNRLLTRMPPWLLNKPQLSTLLLQLNKLRLPMLLPQLSQSRLQVWMLLQPPSKLQKLTSLWRQWAKSTGLIAQFHLLKLNRILTQSPTQMTTHRLQLLVVLLLKYPLHWQQLVLTSSHTLMTILKHRLEHLQQPSRLLQTMQLLLPNKLQFRMLQLQPNKPQLSMLPLPLSKPQLSMLLLPLSKLQLPMLQLQLFAKLQLPMLQPLLFAKLQPQMLQLLPFAKLQLPT